MKIFKPKLLLLNDKTGLQYMRFSNVEGLLDILDKLYLMSNNTDLKQVLTNQTKSVDVQKRITNRMYLMESIFINKSLN